MVYYIKEFQNSIHIKYWFANLICGVLPQFAGGAIRSKIYRLAGFNIGRGAYIMDNLELLSGRPGFYSKLNIGANTLFSSHVTINLDDTVTIEDNVTIGPFVRIYTGTHKIGSSNKRCELAIAKPVIIEKGSWIALGATILPGVRIGYGSVVAAGAVVNKDVPPNSFVTGVPAQVSKILPA